MSIFSKIDSALHTFAVYAEKELTKIYSEEPKIEAVASTVLKYVGPALQILVTAEVGAPAGAIVGSIVKEAQSDLIAVGSLIYDFGATPIAGSIIKGVSDNLGALLTAGHVTSPSSVDTVNKVLNNLNSLAAVLPVAVSAIAAAAK